MQIFGRERQAGEMCRGAPPSAHRWTRLPTIIYGAPLLGSFQHGRMPDSTGWRHPNSRLVPSNLISDFQPLIQQSNRRQSEQDWGQAKTHRRYGSRYLMPTCVLALSSAPGLRLAWENELQSGLAQSARLSPSPQLAQTLGVFGQGMLRGGC